MSEEIGENFENAEKSRYVNDLFLWKVKTFPFLLIKKKEKQSKNCSKLGEKERTTRPLSYNNET